MPGHNLKLGFTKLALQDLEEIWLYSFQHWSLHQADKYQDEIYAACQALTTHIHLGVDVHHIRPGYRKLLVNRHLIYYKVLDEENAVLIVRVLHERMDAVRHLL